jgi:uncharacterized protein YjiS (DUF1127 family)
MIVTQPTTAHRAVAFAPATSRVVRFARRVWRSYWDRRARHVTAQILRSLDARTLHDIGLSPGEIDSVVYGRPGDRTRKYHAGWTSCGGA